MKRQRMICADVLENAAFVALSPRAQLLYVHMMMFADDYGVVDNERLPMQSSKASRRELNELVSARYVLAVGRVYLIKHWFLHNSLRRDRVAPTRWADDLRDVFIREDRVYSDHEGPDRKPFQEGKWSILGL